MEVCFSFHPLPFPLLRMKFWCQLEQGRVLSSVESEKRGRNEPPAVLRLRDNIRLGRR